MRRKSKLRFTSERKLRAKRTKAFILAFVAFVVVFGTASMLVFLNSINFDFQNLLKKPEKETPVTETTTNADVVPVKVTDTNVLFICYDTSNTITLLSLVSANEKENAVFVYAFDPMQQVHYNNKSASLEVIYQKNGVAGLKKAMESAFSISIDRYIKQSATNFKKVIGEIGDISVEIPTAIQYRGADFTLFLDRGKQTLTGDLFIKYLKYCDMSHRADATRAFVDAFLRAFPQDNPTKLFNTVFNYSDTDFSVLDASDANGILQIYLSLKNNVQVGEALQVVEGGS